MSGSIGEVRSQIVHRILIGILPAQHVLDKRLQKVRQPPGVRVQEEGERGEDDIDGLEVAI